MNVLTNYRYVPNFTRDSAKSGCVATVGNIVDLAKEVQRDFPIIWDVSLVMKLVSAETAWRGETVWEE